MAHPSFSYGSYYVDHPDVGREIMIQHKGHTERVTVIGVMGDTFYVKNDTNGNEYTIKATDIFGRPPESEIKKPATKRKPRMNHSLAVLILNDKCRVLKGIYEPDPPKESNKPPSRRELFKTFDTTVKVGDLVIVPSYERHKFSTIEVTDVDVDDWDVNTTENVRWVVGVIDRSHYDDLVAMEEDAVKLIKDSEKTAARKKLRDQMLEHVNEQDRAKLAIAGPNGALPVTSTADPAE